MLLCSQKVLLKSFICYEKLVIIYSRFIFSIFIDLIALKCDICPLRNNVLVCFSTVQYKVC